MYHYHAGLTAPDKQAIEQAFFDSDDAVLFATCAYGIPYVFYINDSIVWVILTSWLWIL